MKDKPRYGIYAWPYFVVMIVLRMLGIALILLSCIVTSGLVLPSGVVLSIFGFYLASAHFLTIKHYEKKEKTVITELAKLFKPGSKKLILDVGSGTGRTAAAIIKSIAYCQALGIDVFSKKTIFGNSPERARRNAQIEGIGEKAFFIYGDAQSIPFKNQCFDIVTAGSVFHLFPDSKRKQVMLEIRRVLKDGGSLLIIEWLRSVKAVLLYLIPAFFMFRSQSYWVQMLQENGLENIKTLTVGSLGIFFAEK